MNWGEKNRNWKQLRADIQSELDANKLFIPIDRIADIEHYLLHGEYSAAFEYLFLEMAERVGAQLKLGTKRAVEIALCLGLNNPDECMIDSGFWVKFQSFLSLQDSIS